MSADRPWQNRGDTAGRDEGHTTWEWPFPVPFVLFRENDEDDENENDENDEYDEYDEYDDSDEEVYLGRCAAVEGLFVDQSPPEREVLTFHACPPGAVPGPLGDTWLEGLIEERTVRGWDLHDAEVLAVVPDTESGLVDVVVGAGLRDSTDWEPGGGDTAGETFRLYGGPEGVLAESGSVSGCFGGGSRRRTGRCCSSAARRRSRCAASCAIRGEGGAPGPGFVRWTTPGG